MNDTIGIIGAGPTGATLAAELASKGKNVLLFDHRASWEKPCGGLLGPGTHEFNQILNNSPLDFKTFEGISFLSIRNEKKFITFDKPLRTISRKKLGKHLLEIAIESGAKNFTEKVNSINHDGYNWILKTYEGQYPIDIIAGADGALSKVRAKTAGKLGKNNLTLSCGYILNGLSEKHLRIEFPDINGYLWIFPRNDGFSAGIGAKLGTTSGKELFKKLDRFLENNYQNIKIKSKWSALVPTVEEPDFFDEPCCGENWLLVGDAAGHVDPVMGEGIYYAMASGKLAAEAILSGNIQSYDSLWREKYGEELKNGARFRQSLSKLAEDFGPEIIGAMMYNYFA